MTVTQFNQNLSKIEDLLFGFAMKLTKNRENAKDLMQETLMRAYDKKERFTLNTNFKAWATTIMYNSYINTYRRRKTRNKVETPMEICKHLVQSRSSDSNTESKLMHKEIVKIVEFLEEDSRIPFLMFYKGYAYNEISEKLDLPIGTTKSRIYYARKKLRKQIVNLYGHNPLLERA